MFSCCTSSTVVEHNIIPAPIPMTPAPNAVQNVAAPIINQSTQSGTPSPSSTPRLRPALHRAGEVSRLLGFAHVGFKDNVTVRVIWDAPMNQESNRDASKTDINVNLIGFKPHEGEGSMKVLQALRRQSIIG